MTIANQVHLGDCNKVLRTLEGNSLSACITDPPYNYEFIGHKWDITEIERRLSRIQDSNTLVKNIPYGSGLAGGVRNARWYQRIRENVVNYEKWCFEWATEVFRVLRPGAPVAVFNSTRTIAHVQVALERAGFYARDILVYRRSSGIPKGLNMSAKLKKRGASDAEKWEGWHSALRGDWEAIALLQKPLVNNYFETVEQYGVGLFKTIQKDGSFQSNILEGFSRDSLETYNVHCTVKPLALMEKLIELLVPSPSDHIVLDPFAGSGTTLVAAKNLGVRYIGIEIVPQYKDIIDKRLATEIPPASKAVTPSVTNSSSETPENLTLFHEETS